MLSSDIRRASEANKESHSCRLRLHFPLLTDCFPLELACYMAINIPSDHISGISWQKYCVIPSTRDFLQVHLFKGNRNRRRQKCATAIEMAFSRSISLGRRWRASEARSLARARPSQAQGANATHVQFNGRSSALFVRENRQRPWCGREVFRDAEVNGRARFCSYERNCCRFVGFNLCRAFVPGGFLNAFCPVLGQRSPDQKRIVDMHVWKSK